jgi:hypothetical protein
MIKQKTNHEIETAFREELKKVMPGYTWTIKENYGIRIVDDGKTHLLKAVGTISSGFNRISTLYVERREKDGMKQYSAKSAGNGLNAGCLTDWFHHTSLRGVLRHLQEHYQWVACKYAGAERSLRDARIQKEAEQCTASQLTP